jgi:hypothetical protein
LHALADVVDRGRWRGRALIVVAQIGDVIGVQECGIIIEDGVWVDRLRFQGREGRTRRRNV